jgi:hypothetical protein
MAERFTPPPPERVAELRAFAERRLSPEAFEAYVHAPVSDFEREQREELIAWFRRRYPTPADRLAYARRAYARWAAAMPPSK